MEIEHVSDTALWVAHYRAIESNRPDALFHDPFAAKLVGSRGREIAEAMPAQKMMAWVMALRTAAIDELILRAVSEGADTVLNLGTGLDTRPYRMKLPANLRWIEVDFESTVNHKNQTLRDDKPVCLLSRIALDLSKGDERRALFSKISAQSGKVVVITEGVIPYLTSEQAAELAADLRGHKNFEFWIQDHFPTSREARQFRPWREKLKRAPFLFLVDDWIRFFENLGWSVFEHRYLIDESRRLKRPPPYYAWRIIDRVIPEKMRDRYRKTSGYVLFKNSK
jgi:methyltransferase (TIGR00027 family)